MLVVTSYVSDIRELVLTTPGLFWHHVPLQMVRAVGENSFQPKIGFKTRYGLVNNPFVSINTTAGNSDPTSAASFRKNQYYRIFRVDNLHGNA